MECLIIGAGRVGISLALALRKSLPHFRILARSEASSERAVACGVAKECVVRELPEVLDNTLVAICVPDSSIPQLAEKLAERIRTGVVVFHISGMLGSDVLAVCARAGAAVCAAHPYQTFFVPTGEFVERYMWGIESQAGAVPWVEDFVGRVGGEYFYLPAIGSDSKALYHASAVFCSNFMNTIISLGKSTARMAGIGPERFMPPILRKTLENNINMLSSSESPMTGPIAREDLEAIQKHISVLGSSDAHMRNAYIYLTLAALEDSIRGGFVSDDFYARAKSVLTDALK